MVSSGSERRIPRYWVIIGVVFVAIECGERGSAGLRLLKGASPVVIGAVAGSSCLSPIQPNELNQVAHFDTFGR